MKKYVYMFFEKDRIEAFREMICSDTVEEREQALAKILPVQQSDFEKLYEALEGAPVTIRFLDPPLHEFVPTGSVWIMCPARRSACRSRGCRRRRPPSGQRKREISFAWNGRMKERLNFQAFIKERRVRKL